MVKTKKVVLVTGISSALGKLIANKFLENDFIVYGGSRVNPKLEKVNYVKLDITSDSNCQSVIKKILKDQGRLDILINVAAVTLAGSFMHYSAKDFLGLLDTNVVGTYRLMQLAIPQMTKQKGGRIINLTSLNGLVSFPGFSIYSASKHAVEAMSLAAGYELKKHNIFITNLAPGAIDFGTKSVKHLQHKPAREKFKILHLILPMITALNVSDKTYELTQIDEPPSKITLGRDAWILTTLQRFLPLPLWENLMYFVWRKS